MRFSSGQLNMQGTSRGCLRRDPSRGPPGQWQKEPNIALELWDPRALRGVRSSQTERRLKVELPAHASLRNSQNLLERKSKH